VQLRSIYACPHRTRRPPSSTRFPRAGLMSRQQSRMNRPDSGSLNFRPLTATHQTSLTGHMAKCTNHPQAESRRNCQLSKKYVMPQCRRICVSPAHFVYITGNRRSAAASHSLKNSLGFDRSPALERRTHSRKTACNRVQHWLVIRVKRMWAERRIPAWEFLPRSPDGR